MTRKRLPIGIQNLREIRTEVSLFSGLNNLNDITLDERYSTLCGYTEADLDTVFGPEFAAAAKAGRPLPRETVPGRCDLTGLAQRRRPGAAQGQGLCRQIPRACGAGDRGRR